MDLDSLLASAACASLKESLHFFFFFLDLCITGRCYLLNNSTDQLSMSPYGFFPSEVFALLLRSPLERADCFARAQ